MKRRLKQWLDLSEDECQWREEEPWEAWVGEKACREGVVESAGRGRFREAVYECRKLLKMIENACDGIREREWVKEFREKWEKKSSKELLREKKK